jgi:hypothetical protein
MGSTASSSEYFVELLSEHGKRRCELGNGDDSKQAYAAYDRACREHAYTSVRLRQGKQVIARQPARQYVHDAHPQSTDGDED